MGPSVAETHISQVFFTADRAYKLLKPVRMPFLDLTDRDTRLREAELELELNRRIAPDVYLGLADVHEGDELVDHMVVMRRLPAERRLSALVEDPRFEDLLRQVVRRVASFHEALPPVRPAPMATRDAVARNWEDNFQAIEASVGTVIDPAEHETVERLARRFLAGRAGLFDQRIADGFVRDGHGDLLADDIYCLDDGPRIIDCLAYSDALRVGDALLDIAFLAMDVHRLAGWEAGRAVIKSYDELTGGHHPPSLAHHYVAYRAHVRAKVACLRHLQGDEASAEVARVHHELARHHLEHGRVRLLVVGGGPGVGKSGLSERLADRYGATVISTDDVRKDLTGTARAEHRPSPLGQGIYQPAITDAAYAEVLRRARSLLSVGRSVVLDGSFSRARQRSDARAVGMASDADVVELECVLDPAAAKTRISRRLAGGSTSSDVTPDLADRLVAARDPWPGATRIDTSAAPDELADRVVAALQPSGLT